MKSNKQRRLEIMKKRRRKSELEKQKFLKTLNPYNFKPRESVNADHSKLAHNSHYCVLPLFYIDKEFKCRDCNAYSTWTAKSQKWWYEIAKGRIESYAIHCRDCRIKRKEKKESQKAHMAEMAARKQHPHVAFFKKRY